MGGDCQLVRARHQESPVIAILATGDWVINPLHGDSGIGDASTVLAVKHQTLHAPVNLYKEVCPLVI